MKQKFLLLVLLLVLKLTSFSQVINNLIPINTATHVAVQNGDWFNGSTWSTGTVPSDASIVYIPNGISVNYQGQSSAHIFAIRVDGEFICTETNTNNITTLTFDTFVGTMSSVVKFKANNATDGKIIVTITPFDIEAHKAGTSGYSQVWNTNAVNHYSDGEIHYQVTYNTDPNYRYNTLSQAQSGTTQVTEASRNAIDDGVGVLGRTSWDSTQLSIGLITMGQVEIFGQEKLAKTKLTTDALAGQSQLIVEDVPSGWKTGDEVIVTRGGNKGATNNGEDKKIIQSISGTVINLTTGLNKNHKGRSQDNLHCYVGNLTRNIIFKSGNTSDVWHRGHFMVMNPTSIKIKNAQFKDMGRTDKSRLLDDFTFDHWVQAPTFKSKYSPLGQEVAVYKTMPANDVTNSRGRYSIHLHRLGASYGVDTAMVTGNVVYGNPGWGITHHHSVAIISDNVIYDVKGAGIVSESGSEMGFWDNNLVVKVLQGHTTSPYVAQIYFDDYLFSGQGLGMKGRAVICRDNVIANAKQGVGIFNMNPNLTNLDRVDPQLLADRIGYEVDNFPLNKNGWAKEGDGVMPQEVALIMENTTVIGCNLGLKSIERDMGVNHESRSIFDGYICWGINQGFSITYQTDYSFNDVFISGKNMNAIGMYLWKHSHNHVFNSVKLVDLGYGIQVSKLVESGNGALKTRNNGFTPWYFIDLTTENVTKLYKIQKENQSTSTNYTEHGDNPIFLNSSDIVSRPTTFTILDSTEMVVDYLTNDFRFEVDGIITDDLGSYHMGVRQAWAQGNLRLGYPERIYEFSSAAKFEEFLSANGVYKDVNNNNQLYFIINEFLPNRLTNQYTGFPVRIKIMNAPTTGVFANPQVEPQSNFDPTYQIVSRLADVSQSSTRTNLVMYGTNIDLSANKAVDGNNNGRKNCQQYQQGLVPIGSWSETNVELEPWYDLDLGELKDIKYIELWNIVDTNGYNMETMGVNFKDFYVLVSDVPFGNTNLQTSRNLADYEYLKDSNPTRKFSLNNLNIQGRYIRIQGIGTRKLEFAEVEVVGKKASVCSAVYGTDVQTACTTFDWIDGNTYTQSNNTATYTIVGGASNGCDSIVTLNLTINQPATGTDVQTACTSFDWIDGNTYTQSNNTATYTIVGGASNGCDSIVTLDLTISPLDITTTVNQFEISANQTGVSYQWIDCNANNSEIAGETNSTYIASYNSSFACVLTGADCSDTTDCVTITGVGIDEYNILDIEIYPNPTNNLVTVKINSNNIVTQIWLTNELGQTVMEIPVTTNQTITINMNNLNSGFYFVHFLNENKVYTHKIIKQ